MLRMCELDDDSLEILSLAGAVIGSWLSRGYDSTMVEHGWLWLVLVIVMVIVMVIFMVGCGWL